MRLEETNRAFDNLAARPTHGPRAQSLFAWTPNPGTALYAGYNDDVNRDGFNPFSRLRETGLRRNGRNFFVEMSYLFRRSL